MLLISFLSPHIGRLARFLVLVPRPGPPFASVDVKMGASLATTIIRAGADSNDPDACRVISEDLNGNAHVEEVLPPGADVEKAIKDTIPRFTTTPIRSLRAMRGDREVARWTPNVWRRMGWAWRKRPH